jgi:hypothetical protein
MGEYITLAQHGGKFRSLAGRICCMHSYPAPEGISHLNRGCQRLQAKVPNHLPALANLQAKKSA